MERWHGGEYIAVAGIEAVEYSEPCHFIEPSEAGYIARCAFYGFEAVESHIPWRSGRMDIVDGESEQVDQKEYQGEMQIPTAAACEVEI